MSTPKALEFETTGVHIIEEFLTEDACDRLRNQVAGYQSNHQLSEIYRPMKGRSLRYSVIDGVQIQRELQDIWDLYTRKVLELVKGLSATEVSILENQRVGVNVNIMSPGRSEYRWHYDRSRLTTILYLNEVEGGETVLYPNYRILLNQKHRSRLQKALDDMLHLRIVRRVFGKKLIVGPKMGRMVVMRGDRCWHSVRSVEGDQERINIIMAYDRPGVTYAVDEDLDAYIYSDQPQTSRDPNYG